MPPGGHECSIDYCDLATLELHIEIKWLSCQDPFVKLKRVKSSSSSSGGGGSCINSTGDAKDTLGQIGAYVAAQLSAQYRTHAFSILIIRDRARIIRWDREGAIVTEPIAYNEEPSLVRFLSLYSQAPKSLRGIDITVSPAPEDEAESARRSLKLSPGTPMFKTSVPRVKPPITQPERSNLTIVFPCTDIIPSRPACRGTRACPAYVIEGGHVVFLKDSWRISSSDLEPEGKIYEQLNDKHVEHIPLCLACGDVDHCNQQKAQTLRLSERSWASRKGLTIVAHTHYRLVLDVVGKSLSEFASSKELVQAMHDTLIGTLLPTHDNY
jgi:hypothetical protein